VRQYFLPNLLPFLGAVISAKFTALFWAVFSAKSSQSGQPGPYSHLVIGKGLLSMAHGHV
jgi:hypothetical protein